MRTSLLTSLWLAFLSGLIIDLLSAELRFGTYALNYSLATLILYNQKRHFFEDKPLSPLPLFTLFFFSLSRHSSSSSSSKEVVFTWKLALTDLCVMPLCDALFTHFFLVHDSFKADCLHKKRNLAPLLRKRQKRNKSDELCL